MYLCVGVCQGRWLCMSAFACVGTGRLTLALRVSVVWPWASFEMSRNGVKAARGETRFPEVTGLGGATRAECVWAGRHEDSGEGSYLKPIFWKQSCLPTKARPAAWIQFSHNHTKTRRGDERRRKRNAENAERESLRPLNFTQLQMYF